MARLVSFDRMSAGPEIFTIYKVGIEKSIAERTTRQALKHAGYSRGRLYSVPFLSDIKVWQTIRWGSWKLDNRKTLTVLLSFDLCCATRMIRTEISLTTWKSRPILFCVNCSGWWCYNGMIKLILSCIYLVRINDFLVTILNLRLL